MASLSYLLCWEYSPVAAFCWHTMIILFRTSHGRADSLPLASPGLTKIAQNISHIAMDGLSSQHTGFCALLPRPDDFSNNIQGLSEVAPLC
jgi:hypothetical protein